jgi:hypothetical protein
MPRSLVDQEDFLAWLEHPVTKWARDRLRAEAVAVSQHQAEHLLNSSPSLPPQEWATEQVRSARLLGRCSGLMEFADLTYDAVREETQEEIDEMEKAKE